MAGNSAMVVAGLTAAALATVGVLALQASADVPADLAGADSPAAAPKAPRDSRDPDALPAASGKGPRVVYSVDDDRVWLVGADGRVGRTFRVTPGNVDPLPGSYAVTSRSGAVTGSDGIPIEHVVRFTTVKGLAVGFSSVVDGAATAPASATEAPRRTGGIRAARADGDAIWEFATIGQRIVVIR
ncbi:hypothetical protein ACFWNK_14540 [Streptomyces sp. NPDC058417]|uniref:hypothetical protein n=1 Tax=unclassified Streptomyces TaxID=2593676 RepID=UPI00364F3BE1